MADFKLYCPDCKNSFEDNYTNYCPICESSKSFLKIKYSMKEFKPLEITSFWKFLPWLPCEEMNQNLGGETIIYKSAGFAHALGLKNLYIAFNGYWPDKGGNMLTCTFKELEAPPSFQRAKEKCIDNLVIASAGNTAKAFIYAAQYFDIKLYVVVPYSCMARLVLPFEITDNVTIIACDKNSDYTDSIAFANRMASELNYINEGGARNVARRAGMGTVMLEAIYRMKRIPQHYFQAIGSGTGAVSVYEAVEIVLEDGNYPGQMPIMHLSQNKPFTPIVDAWNAGSNKIHELDENTQREYVDKIFATVLSNRHPPYSIGGGVYDILKNSNGITYGCTNDEAEAAGELFESTEGIDLVPAAMVAVASLCQAVENANVKNDDYILLNITGGGEKRLWDDFDKYVIEPHMVCSDDIDMQELKKSL